MSTCEDMLKKVKADLAQLKAAPKEQRATQAEKGLSLEPTFNATAQPAKRGAAQVVESAPAQTAVKTNSKIIKPETQKPQSVLEEAFAYHASMDDGVPMADLEKTPEETKKDDRTWFQKGAFDDGYQRGDVTKAVLGTKTDAQVDVAAGGLGLGEKLIDTVAWLAPYFAEGQYYQNGGVYQPLAQQEQFRNDIAQQKEYAAEFIEKDLYDEKKAAEWIVNNATIDGQINKLLGVDAERDSVLGEKTDALMQSAGQLAAQYGLTLIGVPWFVTSGVSSFGSEVEGALQQGASMEEAGLSGMVTAGAEVLTEKLFGGDLFVNKAGFDDLVDELTMGISNKFVQKAAQLGLNAAGEGAEEWLSQRIGQFGQWLTYNHDEKELLELLYSEESINEAVEAFLGGVALGGGMGAINAVSSQQAQGGSVAVENTQAGNGQVAQETAAKAEPGTLEYVQNIIDKGKTVDRGLRYKASKINQSILQMVDRVKKGMSSASDKVQLNPVSDEIAAKIQELTGVDARGFKVAIEARQIEHILKDHGENGVADRSMANPEDIAKIEYALTDPDSIVNAGKTYAYVSYVNGRNRKADTVLYEKQNGDGSYYVVQAVPDTNKKTLYIVTAFIGKSGYKNTEVPQFADASDPGATPKAESTNTSVRGEQSTNITDPSATPKAAAAGTSINSISQTAPGVNTNSDQSAEPSIYDKVMETIPEGENPVRSDDLPKKDYTGKDVSYTARTVKGAEVTPDSFVDLLNKETAEGGLSYVKITNDATVQKAIGHITEEGWDVAKAMWHADVRAGKAGADLSAVGALLLNNAAKAGDKAAWLDILHDYQLLGTNTAQGLQALRILKQLSPSDKLYMAKRSVKQMVKDMKLDTDVTIDPELETEYNEATTDEERDAVLVKIQKNVAQQLPTTFMEKFTALRYVNMLGNLRTQIRNVAGNITMKGTRAIHNTIASGIEAIVNKASGGKVGRTRSTTVSKAQKAAAAKDFDSLQGHILDGGKYSDNMTATGFARGVQEQKQIFKFKPLEGYRKVTNWAMEQGDLIFAKDAYARALAGYLKANGITETDYSKIDPAIMDDARLFAAKEAQEATFRDTNWLSGWVSKIGRRKDTPAVGRLLSEGIMPFRKTPANVLVRAEEYSPLGVINSVVMSVQAARKGSEVTANQVINSWAKTLTGTGLFGMGMLLQSLGMLSAGPDDDESKDGFEDLNGWQDYALTLPDGTNLTVDFLSPSAIPVLMGAQLMNEIRENGFDLKDIGSALTSVADPLVEMSMLQGVNDSLENIQYADSNLGQFVINAAVSYLTQGLTNTLVGQLERSFEKSRMQTYVDKDSELPAWLQRTLGKASAKTPIWDHNQIPYINAWGEEEENPSTGLNLVYNLLSPSYFDKGKDDDLTRELNRLNDVQSDVNVYPSVPDKTMKINKQDYNLSAGEYVDLAKLQGQTQKQIVEDLMANSYYEQLSDEDKAQAIRYAYDYARDIARGEVVGEHPGITTKWMQSIGADPAEGIIRHIAADDNYTSLSVSDASYVDKLLADLLPETGKTNVRTIQQVEAVAGSKLSEKDQKAVLEDTLDDKAYANYLRILALGMDTDDYADSYRTYLDEKDVGGKGTKERIIAQFQDELDVSKSVAEKLYDIYAGAK